MPKTRGIAMVLASLALGAGLGAAVAGCGEDRGSLEVEGDTGTTGTTGTVGTTGTTTTP
jgi:hypothetical protein